MHGKTAEQPREEPRVRTEPERRAIQEQLERILANPLFRNSKRYPNLLRYVAEHALRGETGELKERTRGVEVFGREPDYDTNLDPVVRTTAGEIRKRIAQYYHEPGRESEIRIDIPPGSYIPEFRTPPAAPIPLPLPQAEPVTIVKQKKAGLAHWLAAGLIPALVVLTLWSKPWVTRTALDKFWGPVVESAIPVLLCVGQRPNVRFSPADLPFSKIVPNASRSAGTTVEQPLTAEELYLQGSQNLTLPDVSTLARVAGVLQARGHPYRIRGESVTTLADLRDGPVVLIGAFNNDWSGLRDLSGLVSSSPRMLAGSRTARIPDGRTGSRT